MSDEHILFSDDEPLTDWTQAGLWRERFGAKGATLLVVPKPWVPPFVLISADIVGKVAGGESLADHLVGEQWGRIRGLGHRLIVRSSVVGETIWDRGTYLSIDVNIETYDDASALDDTVRRVAASAPSQRTGVVIQTRISATERGEFGNLQRVSKTRDHWEVSTVDLHGGWSRRGVNSQRDQAANPNRPIEVRAGIPRERLFAPVAAWINNELLRGKAYRVNCEWVTDNKRFYIVQIDEEGEDLTGVNPLQIRIQPFSRPAAQPGSFLAVAEGDALGRWDKLQVLNDLWEDEAIYKPTLFFVSIDAIVGTGAMGLETLRRDFLNLIGNAGIIVRTSVLQGAAKITNLPRTECMDAKGAAEWCMNKAEMLLKQHGPDRLAFVAHRFVASRASAWVRAKPDSAMVEVHALWGLPDALQYCPYDIWEVHVSTGHATDYPDYKSEVLIATDDGGWEHARVKNDFARSNAIKTNEAKDVAARTLSIAQRLKKPIHVMWFIGCVDDDENLFNIPWYWTEAHDAERNSDRTSYTEIEVRNREDLDRLDIREDIRHRTALALRPTDLELMRDNSFLEQVASVANAAGVPVILSGSTLAHAYYQLRKSNCAVVTASEKDHSRVRNSAGSGKMVRDKIPARIAARQEARATRQVPDTLRRGYLVGKLLEEALEVRSALLDAQKVEELADLYEVVRGIIHAHGFDMTTVQQAAEVKREKVGGFEEGLLLLQTGIASSGELSDSERNQLSVLGKRTGEDSIEIPFSFFGFMELDQPRSVLVEQLGLSVDLTLRPDRLQIRVQRSSEQLGLGLDE